MALTVVLTILGQLVFVGGIFFVVVMMFRRHAQKRQEALQQFAAEHHMTIQSSNEVQYDGLLNLGVTSNVMRSETRDTSKQIQVFHSVYTTGSGKNRRMYSRTIASVPIRPSGIHAYINSVLNDVSEQISLDASQRYIAEGDFGKYFEMYFPLQQHTKGLAIFAPDVMQVIMADYGHLDIEIQDTVLYLYEYKTLTSVADLGRFYQLATKLAEALNSNAPRMLNLPVASDAMPAGQTKRAIPRLQIGTSWVPLGVFLLIFGFTLYSMILPVERRLSVANVTLTVVMFGIIFLLAGISSVKAIAKRKAYQNDKKMYARKPSKP